MSNLHPVVERVTARIIERSKASRARYLDLMEAEGAKHGNRSFLGCSNLAHGFAGAEADQAAIAFTPAQNIGIVTAYNDMLSAHQPYGRYPEAMKLYAREVRATAQVAGGVPAMCDGVTQGYDGMELSLFSRDVIALSTAVSLSHAMYDGVACLALWAFAGGVCAQRPHAQRHRQQGKAEGPPAICAGAGGARGAAEE